MARMPVIAGNWKMHKTVGEARSLVQAVRDGAAGASHCKVVLAPPYTALYAVAEMLRNTPLVLAAQNVYWEPNGAFTGEVSLPMLEDIGCGMVIIGHSERRLKSKLQPIVCIGESLDERESGRHYDTIAQQLAAGLDGLTGQTLLRIILAYEPVWAIGTGRTASPETAQEMHVFIRNRLSETFGEEAQKVRILYGGSVKPGNIASLMRQPDVDGALVGGACLEAGSFLDIIHYDS
ncbi:MAG: triose-phosphate isomerase [Acidobacteriota bacterium]